MMKITRSFSHKHQIKKFEDYVEAFCAAEMEVEPEEMGKASQTLDEFVRAEVKKTIKSLTPNATDRINTEDNAYADAVHDLEPEYIESTVEDLS